MVNLMLQILWRNTTKVLLSHHVGVIATSFTLGDVNFYYLVKEVTGRILQCKTTIFLFHTLITRRKLLSPAYAQKAN